MLDCEELSGERLYEKRALSWGVNVQPYSGICLFSDMHSAMRSTENVTECLAFENMISQL